MVRDDGKGFDQMAISRTAGGLGLLNMRERLLAVQGSCEVESVPGKGRPYRCMCRWYGWRYDAASGVAGRRSHSGPGGISTPLDEQCELVGTVETDAPCWRPFPD